MFTNTWELNRSRMEDGQRRTDHSVTEIRRCTPVECRRKHNDGGDVEPATHKEQLKEQACRMMKMREESVNDEDMEEGDGIQDMSQLGAGAVAVKFQTVHQQSFQLVDTGTTSLQVPGTAALTPASTSTTCVVPGATSLQVQGTSALTPASTSTTCVVPGATSLQVPGTAALTPASTLSPLPSIPASLMSQIQSSGLPEVPMTGDSPAVTQYNLLQVQQQFGDVTVKGGKNLNIGGTQNIGTTPTNKEEEEIPLTAAQKIRKIITNMNDALIKEVFGVSSARDGLPASNAIGGSASGWKPRLDDADPWIEFGVRRSMYLVELRIHKDMSSVTTSVWLRDGSGLWIKTWTRGDGASARSDWFFPHFRMLTVRTDAVRLTFDDPSGVEIRFIWVVGREN